MTPSSSVRLLAAVAVTLLAGGAAPPDASGQVPLERGITTAGPGPQRLAVDAELLTHGAPFRITQADGRARAEGGLTDLRLMTRDGRAIPHLLVYPPDAQPAWTDGMLLPVAATKTTSGFEADLGDVLTVDLVHIDGLPVPYLKRVRLEGSGDRQHWTLLVSEGTLFDLPDEQHRQNALAFPAGAYRYLRVTWDDRHSGRLPMPAGVRARRVAMGVSPPPAVLPVSRIERRPSEPGVSRFRLTLPARQLPIVALDLDVGGGHVYRRVEVNESRLVGSEAMPHALGSSLLTRGASDPSVATAALRVPIGPPQELEIELVVRDTGNDPLDVRAVSVVLAPLPWIYFEAPEGPVVARYGRSATPAPVYDLEAVRASVNLSSLPEARWDAAAPAASPGGLTRLPEPAVPGAGTVLDPGRFAFIAPVLSGRHGALVVLPLSAHVLAHSRGPAGRFADVRLLDRANRQIPYLLERQDEVLPLDLTLSPADGAVTDATRNFAGRRQSVYRFSLPYPNLPAGQLVVDTPSRLFTRTARVGFEHPVDRQTRHPWFDPRLTVPWTTTDDRQSPTPLVARFSPGDRTDWLLLIDDGDNAAVATSGARLLLPAYRLRFFAPAEGDVRLVYGGKAVEAPQYDLQLMANRLMGASAEEVLAGAPVAAAAPEARPTFVTPTVFALLLGGAALALLAMIARLLRR